MNLVGFWIGIASVLSLALDASAAPKPLTVGLHAKWEATSVLHEAAEFISKEYGEYWFWNYVSKVTEVKSHMTERDAFEWAENFVKDAFGGGAVTLLNRQLAARTYAPTVVLHNSVSMEILEAFEGEGTWTRSDEVTFATFQNDEKDAILISNPDQLDTVFSRSTKDMPKGSKTAGMQKLREEHVFKENPGTPVVILHSSFGSHLQLWHSKLTDLANSGKVTYVLRYYESLPISGDMNLDGYSVTLFLKRVDYVVVDDKNFTTQLFPYGNSHFLPDENRQALSVADTELTLGDVDEDKLRCAAVRVVEHAVKGGLEKFVQMVEDFPAWASEVGASTDCNDQVMESVEKDFGSAEVDTREEFVLINDFLVNHKDTSVLMNCGMQLVKYHDAFLAAGLKDYAPTSLRAPDDSTFADFRLDLSSVDPMILNDIETDSSYDGYMTDWTLWAKGDFEPYKFRGNFVNIIATAVASDYNQYAFFQLFQNILSQGLPFKCGVILVPSSPSDELSKKIIVIARKIYKLSGAYPAFTFLSHVAYHKLDTDDGLIAAAKDASKSFTNTMREVLRQGQTYVDETLVFKEKLRLDLTEPLVTVNGIPTGDVRVLDLIDKEIARVRARIVDMKEKMSSEELVYGGISTFPRRSKVAQDDSLPRLSMAPIFTDNSARSLLKSLRYLQREEGLASVTAWICGDLSSAEGVRTSNLLIEAYDNAVNGKGLTNAWNSSRFALIATLDKFADLEKKLSKISSKSARKYLESLRPSQDSSESVGLVEQLVCGSQTSSVEVILNGRRVPSTSFQETEDFDLLLHGEQSLTGAIVSNESPDNFDSDGGLLIAETSARLRQVCGKSRKQKFRLDAPSLSAYTISSAAAQEDEVLQVRAQVKVSNPLSGTWIRHLLALRDAFKAAVTILAVPEELRDGTSQFAYRRRVVALKPTFDESGNRRPSSSEGAVFTNLPQKRILTMSFDTPRFWLIESAKAAVDIDNIILSSVPASEKHVHVDYALDALLVDGSCIDENYRHTKGVQLVLKRESKTESEKAETIVMENVGYFQFKVSKPALWYLSLASTRSSEIYRLHSIGDVSGESALDGKEVVPVQVDSLSGANVRYLKLAKREGRESDEVLNQDAGVNHSSNDDETVNIFSVASGHLYERFLKIMMLSVRKNCSKPVKFWLLKNHLSPGFKSALPHFAKTYDFQFELITFKWPTWLREQTEKQRTIWGYKILFLDVLFPLNLRRVIFVDSDQIVRGDLNELYQMDIKGAPYAFTPFCDSRKEVEGYRFWKQGFWRDHLGRHSYHISALYLVDLDAFRQLGAGDTLRVIYQQLSADPNSLANLDQDLPNYASVESMATSVPIFSLGPEWLWCETWCDDASKKKAKTIDLCNNPMTKEPKLEGAVRIVSEWTSLDDEATIATEQAYEVYAGLRSEPTESSSSEHDEL